MPSILHLFTTRMPVVFLFTMMLASTSSPQQLPRSTEVPRYELIYTLTDSNFEETGSIMMQCRDAVSAETKPLSNVQFYLNGTNICDQSLGISITNIDDGIKFNLTRRLDGYYKCGGRDEEESMILCTPKAVVSSQTLLPIPDAYMPPILSFTAMVGNRVVLPCPIQPGALLQYYSVMWKKDSIVAAEITETQTIEKTNNKYDIDRSTYELIINPVSANDSSTNYQCHVFSRNPTTHVKQELQYSPQSGTSVLLSLTVTKCAPLPSTAITTIVNNYSYTTGLYVCSNITTAAQAD